MDKWHFFQFLYEHFDVPFMNGIRGITASVTGAVRGPMIAAATLYIAGISALELYAPGHEPISAFLRKVIRVGVVMAAIAAANYTDLFGTFVLTTLPNQMVNMVSGSSGNDPQAMVAFDKVFSGSWVAGIEVYKGLSVWSSDGLGLMVVVGMYFIASALAIALGFAVFVITHISSGILIATGPIFICFWLFPATKPWFDRWISTTLGLVMAQVFIIAILTLAATVEAQVIKDIAALNGKGGTDQDAQFAQLHLLIEAVMLFGIVGFLIKTMPVLATSIMGNLAPGIAMATGVVSSAMSSGAMATGRGAAAASGSTISSAAAGLRSLKPAGRAP